MRISKLGSMARSRRDAERPEAAQFNLLTVLILEGERSERAEKSNAARQTCLISPPVNKKSCE
jgi:hypothetical protein